MRKLFIGIDFSLSSPAISIITPENKLFLISLLKVDSNIEKAYSSPVFKELKLINELTFVLHPKDKISKENYSVQEREKLLNSIKYVDLLTGYLKEKIKDIKYDEIYISMEGISFGSSGNTLIDISMATSILRMELIKICKPENFYVFSPSTIKKYAGKGNYKKLEMYEAIVNLDDNSSFIEILKNRKDLFITPKGVVKKPAEDLIDAIWVSKLLKNNIENG